MFHLSVEAHGYKPVVLTVCMMAFNTKTPLKRGGSSVGRARRSQCRGQGFDPPSLHQSSKFLRNFKLCFEISTLEIAIGTQNWYTMGMGDVAKNFNLIQIGNKWHYRRRVPKDLSVAFENKTFIKYALKTSDLKEARQFRDIEEVKWNEKFNKLRAGATDSAKLPIQSLGNEEAKELIREYVARELKRFTRSIENHPPSTAEMRKEKLMDEAFVLDNLKSETSYADEWISTAWNRLEAQATAQKVAITANESVVSHLLRALIEIANVKFGLLNHDYSKTYIDPAFSPQAPVLHRFKKLADLYIEKYKETAKLNDRTPKAVDKVIQNVSLIVELVGVNTPVSSLDFDMLETLRFKLAQVPTNYKKVFKGKSIDEAILLGTKAKVKVLSHKSQRQYLGAFQHILKLAVAKRWLQSLPQVELKPVTEQKIKDKDKKEAFTVAQLKTFFGGTFYKAVAAGEVKLRMKPDFEWRFWFPIIALYSGMRGNEIALLLTLDIQQTEKGTDYFEVTDEASVLDGIVLLKSVKTGTSVRKIPIHRAIIELGFLDFVARRRLESGNARLFDQLKPDKYGNMFTYAGRRFNESFLPKEMGISDRQSFHCFRHSFRNALRQTNASPDTLQALGAWDQGSLTSSDYGELSQPDQQKQFIEGVVYGDLDLSYLKSVSWADNNK